MKKLFYLQEEFKEWLHSEFNISLNEANSYIKNIEVANLKYLLFAETDNPNKDMFEMLDSHLQHSNWSVMDNAILNIIHFSNQKDIPDKLKTPNELVRNWVEALFHYRCFLDFYLEIKIEPEQESDWLDKETDETEFNDYKFDNTETAQYALVENLNVCSVYSLNDLYEILKLRISHQDMYNHPVYYPLNFIKHVLFAKGEKQFFENFIIYLVDNVDIHIANKKLKFKNISNIKINNSQVFVGYKGKYEQIFTKLSDNKNLKPFIANSFKDIAIDYEVPILEILYKFSTEFAEINKISSELQRTLNDAGCENELKIVSKRLLESEFINSLDVEKLKSELQFFSSKLKLQLMESKERQMKVILDIL